MALFYLLGYLLLINAQVNSTPLLQDVHSELDKFEKWLSQKADAITKESTNLGINLLTQLQSEIKNGQTTIENITTAATKGLTTWQEVIGADCLKNGTQQLEVANETIIWEFVRCSKLLDAADLINKMNSESMNIAGVINDFVKRTKDGVTKCINNGFVKDTDCILNYTFDVIRNINNIPEVSSFKESLRSIEKKVNDDFYYCLSRSTTKMDNEVAKIMADTKQCMKS